MEKIIPILPCTHIQEQVDFYKNLGFELVQLFTQPNAYAVLRYGEIEMHFYGNKKFIASENPSMCIIQVDDVDKVCEAFTAKLKKAYGAIPRSGIPRITKVRDLKDDRRFTLTDTGGNTIYVCTPNANEKQIMFRTLENQNFTKDFAVLYDLIYSKEDKKVAANMLSKLSHIKDSLSNSDMAKFLIVELEIQGLSAAKEAESLLTNLMEQNKGKDIFWGEVEKRYNQLLAMQEGL